MRTPRPLDPTRLHVVTRDGRPLTPRFYHQELGAAAARQIGKLVEGAELQIVPATTTEGGFEDGVAIVSRETRWLAMARQEKGAFQTLCEGWVTMAQAAVTADARIV